MRSIAYPRGASGRTTAGASRSRARHRFPIDKYALLRERVVADGLARADEVHEPEPVAVGGARSASTTPSCCARIRDGELSVREERGLGLPWSPELVERGAALGRRARSPPRGTRSSAASRMNLGGGTHHAGRAFARGYCLFNDVAVALARAARATALARAGAGRRLRRPPGRRHRRPLGPRPARVHALAARRAQLPVPAHPVRPRRRPRRPAPATPTTSRRSTTRSTSRSPLRGPTSRSTSPAPTRGRATGSAASRSPRRACAPATSCVLDRLRATGVAGLRRARRRLRARTSATPSTSTRRPPPRSRQG